MGAGFPGGRAGEAPTSHGSIGWGVSELRRLRYFLAVARERNFTRAADGLHIAQPALSRQVRLLEQDLGVALLRRTTHEVELTPAGRFLFERGPALLGAADDLWRGVRAFGAGERGEVSVGYGTSAGYETAPRLLGALGARLPDVAIATRVATLAEIVVQVGDGTLDVGIARCPRPEPGIDAHLVRLERQGVLLRGDHPRAGADAVAVADLRDETLLMHPREDNPGHFDAVLELCTAAGYEPRLAVRTLSFDLAQTPVATGEAVAVVGESTLAGLPPDLVWIPLSPPALLEIALLVRERDRPPVVDRLLSVALDVARELGWLPAGHAAAR
jgi:DNA-binding transcriptional LysR family regulator